MRTFTAAEFFALADWAERHTGETDPVFTQAVHETVAEPKCIQEPSYNRSLDAAISLLPPGSVWRKYTDPSASVYAASPYNAQAQVRYDGTGANPALQIVAANFRMRAAFAAAREARTKPHKPPHSADGHGPTRSTPGVVGPQETEGNRNG